MLSRPREHDRVGELVSRALDDLKVIIRAELELAKTELSGQAKHAAIDVGVILGGALVVLFGAAMLCGAIVAGIAVTIIPLWASLLIVGTAFVAGGAVVSGIFYKRLRQTQLRPEQAELEARQTVEALQSASHGTFQGTPHRTYGEQPSHA